MVEINHALRIVWNLSGDLPSPQEPVRHLQSKLLEFLQSSYRPPSPAQQHASFVMSPDSEAPCLTACLAALRITQQARLPELDGLLASCGSYVRACESPAGGFGSSIRHTPDLLHTYMAVSLAQAASRLVENPLENPAWAAAKDSWSYLGETSINGVLTFVDVCSKRAGYSLVPEWKASAYGTRLAFQILTRLGKPIVNALEMREFIRGLLSPEREGSRGYAGHHLRVA